MTNQELELAILDIIRKVYEAEYTGRIKVISSHDCGDIYQYELILGMNNFERPIRMGYQGNQQDFLKYIDKELRRRYLHHTSFYCGYKVDTDGNKCKEE